MLSIDYHLASSPYPSNVQDGPISFLLTTDHRETKLHVLATKIAVNEVSARRHAGVLFQNNISSLSVWFEDDDRVRMGTNNNISDLDMVTTLQISSDFNEFLKECTKIGEEITDQCLYMFVVTIRKDVVIDETSYPALWAAPHMDLLYQCKET